MSGKTSKSNNTSSKAVTATTTSSSSGAIHPGQRIMQNFLLIWLDAGIDRSNEDCQNTLLQLRNVVNEVHIFTQSDECIDYLTDVDNMKAILIIEDTLGQQILPLIHDIPQLDAVYIFCNKKSSHEHWTKAWKVKGLHTEVTPICESLQQAVKQFNQNSIALSFVAVGEGVSRPNLNQLEPSFMYTQLYKEILLEMKYNEESIKNLTTYCRNGDYGSLTNITLFENEYNPQLAIWWYTYPSFIYSLLNGALRMLEADTIINMGFYIRDLHHQIEQLHQKQVTSYKGKPFVIYRGQGLSTTDFDELCKTKGGLMSFNNFLSTSTNEEVSLGYAKIALTKTETVGVLFQMSVDPSVSSAPFAAIREVSYFGKEEEILFSMHTVFRIGEIKQIDNNSPLYQVELKLTSDDDQQLRTLIEHMREETEGCTGWTRLGALLIKTSHFDKAEELYNTLLKQTSDESEKAAYYSNLQCLKVSQGDYEKAIWYSEKALEIFERTLPPNHPDLATSYNNIGGVYTSMQEFSKALSFYEKALKIVKKSLPPNHPNLATSYNNISEVYKKMGKYSRALSFDEKALDIRQKTLPPNHPDLATSYNNIGMVYKNMGVYSKALSFAEKALEIRQKTLPPNHPDLANSYDNIGGVYDNMGEYSKALSSYEKALEIKQKTLSPNHPSSATSYNNIGEVYNNTGEYSRALSFYEKALEIFEKTFSPNHLDLATAYNNIGTVYDSRREYSKALSYYANALEIRQKTLPPDHLDFAQSYNNIAAVYYNMREYSKALSFYEKSLEIGQKILSPNHPLLATSYNNIGAVYNSMEEYTKALLFYKNALAIRHKALPANHLDFAQSFNNIATVYYSMREYSNAVIYFERALNILQRSLPRNHPNIKTVQENIELLKKTM